MIPVLVRIFALIQQEMLDQRLTIDTNAFLAGPADCLVRLFTGYMDDIQRHARYIGNHDRTVGRLAFDLRRARKGMCLGAVIALFHQLGLKLGHNITILGMHQWHCTQFGAALETGIHLVIIHH